MALNIDLIRTTVKEASKNAPMPPGQQAMMNAAKIATPAGASALPPPIQQAETPGDVVSAEQQAAEAEKLEQQRRSELDKKDQEIHKLQGEIQQAKLDNEREKIRAEQKEREMQMQADLQKREQAYLTRMRQEQKALDQKQNNFAVSEAKHKAQLEKDTAAEQVKLEQAKSKALMDIAKQESDRYIKTTEDAKRTADAYFDQQKKELEAARSAVSPALMSQMQGAVKSIQGLAKLRQKSAVESVLPKSANYKPTVQESKDMYGKARGMSLADMEKARIQADVAASKGQDAAKNKFLRDFYSKRLSEAVPSREYYGHKGDAKLSEDFAQHKGLTRNGGAGTQALRDIYTGDSRPWYDNGKSDWLSKIGYGAGKALDWWFWDPVRQTVNAIDSYNNATAAARDRGESLRLWEHLVHWWDIGSNGLMAVGGLVPIGGMLTRGARAGYAATKAYKAMNASKGALNKARDAVINGATSASGNPITSKGRKAYLKTFANMSDEPFETVSNVAQTNSQLAMDDAIEAVVKANPNRAASRAYTKAQEAYDKAVAAHDKAKDMQEAVKGMRWWNPSSPSGPLFFTDKWWGKLGNAVTFPVVNTWKGQAFERMLNNTAYNWDDPNVHWLQSPFYRPDYTEFDEDTRQYLLKAQQEQMQKSGAAEPTYHAQAVNDYATRSRGVTSTAYEGRPEWAKWVETAAPFLKQLTGGMIDVTAPTSVDGPKPYRIDLNPSLVGAAMANPFGHLQRGGRNTVPLYNYLRAKKRELEPSRGEQHVNDRHRMNYGVGVR